MPITVTIVLTSPFTDLEQRVLHAFDNGVAPAPVAVPFNVPAAVTPPKPAAAAPKAQPKPEPKPEPEEDLVGDVATLEDAVSRATTLVASGKTAQVKAALAAAGAKRVSELSGAKIGVFMGALDA